MKRWNVLDFKCDTRTDFRKLLARQRGGGGAGRQFITSSLDGDKL